MIPRSACRICGHRDIEVLLDLGEQPLANAFIRREDLDQPEPRYPLELCRCPMCGHTQLSVTVPPEILFRTYPYRSGTSRTITQHFAGYARHVQGKFLPKRSFVVEIGSNDGTLLRAFDLSRTRVLGVEPARNIAAHANAGGIETITEFFTETLASEIAASYGRADAIIANNVVAHIDDLNGLMSGVQALLAPNGVFIAEFPYLLDLLRRVEYDTIYHEHLSYFAVAAARDLFSRVGLKLFDVRRSAVHGGSLRVFVGRAQPELPSIQNLLRSENEFGLRSVGPFRVFAEKVVHQRVALRGLLLDLKAKGDRLAGYGAAAKGSTLLNYCGIDRNVLEYIVDLSPLKQGLFTPGGHIPVAEPELLLNDLPDHTLLLAWNFADEILEQEAEYRRREGRFIIPIPYPRVV